jgi:hypothetical protein
METLPSTFPRRAFLPDKQKVSEPLSAWDGSPAHDLAIQAIKSAPDTQSQMYWIKTAGLYPSYEEMDDSLAQTHNWNVSAELGEAQHALMQDIFESRCDVEKMTTAAEIIGARGNVQAMTAMVCAFQHGMGVAYRKSGWNGGAQASRAIAAARKKLVQAWHGINGFVNEDM